VTAGDTDLAFLHFRRGALSNCGGAGIAGKLNDIFVPINRLRDKDVAESHILKFENKVKSQ
jgi:hypothetical protein